MLTRERRRVGFKGLALAEADDGTEVTGRAVSVGTDPPMTAVPMSGALSPLDVLSAAAAARDRVEGRGCPHALAGRFSGGVMPAACRRGDCGRTFNALTGTPTARPRKKDRWADQAKALITGESIARAAKRCGVAHTTAFHWRHRFLPAPAGDKPDRLTGIVEADGTFILESFKGRRQGLPRPARKRGGKAAKRGLSAEQVLVARYRSHPGRGSAQTQPRRRHRRARLRYHANQPTVP